MGCSHMMAFADAFDELDPTNQFFTVNTNDEVSVARRRIKRMPEDNGIGSDTSKFGLTVSTTVKPHFHVC